MPPCCSCDVLINAKITPWSAGPESSLCITLREFRALSQVKGKTFPWQNKMIVHYSGPERPKNVNDLLCQNTWHLVTHRVPGVFQVVGIEKQQKHKYQMLFGIL